MKWIRLSDNDYKLFDQEVDSEQNDFMQSSLRIWEEMFLEQGQPFWLHFLISYRSFTLNYGFASNLDNVFFPLCKSKVKRLIDEACVAIHKEFIDANFNEVKKLFDDIVVVVKNRHRIPYLGSQSTEEDPFYHEDTKSAYRYLFCESGDSTSWKVAVGVPFYLKFAGAVCNILKRWTQEKSLDDKELEDVSKNRYWTVPAEWHDKDFKPGIFEQYLLKFWSKKLAEVLGVDGIYEKFSQKIIYDPCYLDYDSSSCICDNHSYGTDDVDSSYRCTKKIVHKSGGCRIRSDLLPSEISNTIAQAQKVHDTKERLRKKLGKKLRDKGENNAITDDCAADSDWRLKLLEKAEKQFKKESKTTQKKCEIINSDAEKQTKASNKVKKPDLKECSGTVESIDVTYISICARNVKQTSQKQSSAKTKKCPEKTKTTGKNNKPIEKETAEVNTTKLEEDTKINTNQINVEKDKNIVVASSSNEKDELAKDLEDIGDNLDSIEKSIKEKGGLDLDEFKLLLETGRLLMKESKSLKTDNPLEVVSTKVAAKLHVCAQCMSKESAPKVFKKCSRCKLEKFAVPRYYCSKKCQVEDWEESHRDEHLRASGHRV